MSLKVNVGVSRKVSENFASTGYSLNLEGEIQARVDDPETVVERIKEYYDLAEEALRQQLARRQGPDPGPPVALPTPPPPPAPDRPAAAPPPTDPPAANYTPPPHGGGGDPASPKPVQFIQNLGKRRRLSVVSQFRFPNFPGRLVCPSARG